MSFLKVIKGAGIAVWTGLGSIWAELSGYLLLGIGVIALISGLYWSISHNASQTQLLKDQKAQLEQVLKNQKQFAEDTKYLVEAEKRLSAELAATIQNINTKNDKLDAFLDSTEAAKANRESSQILKETIRQLGK